MKDLNGPAIQNFVFCPVSKRNEMRQFTYTDIYKEVIFDLRPKYFIFYIMKYFDQKEEEKYFKAGYDSGKKNITVLKKKNICFLLVF